MTYLIDTDVLVDFFKHKTYAKGLIEKLSSNSTLALSPLTITELRSGWTSEQADFLLPRLYALCAVVPVTKEIAEQAGKWRQEYKSKGLRRFLKKNFLIQDVGVGLIKMSYLGNAGWRFNRFSTACIAAFPSEIPFW